MKYRGCTSEPTAVPFRAWLYRIAHNAVVDHYRKQKDAVLWDDLLSVPDTRHTPEEVILSQERSAQVHEAMAEIKPVYKEVLSHRFLNNMDYAETAEVLDRKVNAVRVLQHRALNALQKTLGHQAITWIAIIATFASMGLGTQAIRASESARPGDTPYALKTRIEDTLLTLYDDAGDAQLYESYASRRLAEIEALLETDRLGDVQTAASRLATQFAEMSAAITAVGQDNPELAEELVGPLQASQGCSVLMVRHVR